MKLKIGYIAVSGLLLITLCLTLEQRAYAYVDPGSSLLIYQSFTAMITGGLFYFRRRLKSLFFRSKAAEIQSNIKRD
ncbi:hypothetical protein [Granulicella sp. L60]|uniref:hypothetical protein n=1 Tax=Granulicella sp. L60 TaxID=1641866 RepID=UPI001C20B01D|nr:hypothetical protein [Granulicella sp. L60]